MSESLILTIASIGGSFFIGIVVGYFVKKIIKILMFIAGGILALLLYLQQQRVFSVDIDRLEGSSEFLLNSVVSSFYNITQIGDGTSLAIPLAGSLSAGLAIGFLKG